MTDVDVATTSADGLALRGRHWAVPAPRGVLVVSHGYGEHGGAYDATARALGPALGVDVVAFDFRGHGRSAGRRGVVRAYDDLLGDLRAALAWAARRFPGLPRFVLAHSNGGLVALKLAAARELDCDALVLSNPAVRLSAHVPPGKRRLGQFLARVAPWVTLTGDLPTASLTSDPAEVAARMGDTLRHARISPPLFFGMVAGGLAVAERAPSIAVPTLILLGGSDPVVDPAASRALFDRMTVADRSLIVYPEARHEPLNDLGRDRVLADVVAWLSPRLTVAST